jgi:hypothetical protein
VVSPQWNESDEAQQALRAIVSNPVYGVAALSSPQTMANLLKDLMPDAPREVSILVAAAEAGVAGSLREHVSQGMDIGTASAVVAGSFAAGTPYKPEACTWAVGEIAGALGLSKPVAGPAPGSSVPSGSSVPGGDASPTISTPAVSATAPGSGGYPGEAVPGGYRGAVPGAFSPGGFPPVSPIPSAQAPPGPIPPGAVQPDQLPFGSIPPGTASPGQVSPGSYLPASPFPGQAPGGYQPQPVPGYWSPPQAPGFVPVARTNGLAIASLVLGVLWLFWLGSLVGLILGLLALKQIKDRHQGGRGIAIAGVVLSVLWLIGFVVAVIVGAANGS